MKAKVKPFLLTAMASDIINPGQERVLCKDMLVQCCNGRAGREDLANAALIMLSIAISLRAFLVYGGFHESLLSYQSCCKSA